MPNNPHCPDCGRESGGKLPNGTWDCSNCEKTFKLSRDGGKQEGRRVKDHDGWFVPMWGSRQ